MENTIENLIKHLQTLDPKLPIFLSIMDERDGGYYKEMDVLNMNVEDNPMFSNPGPTDKCLKIFINSEEDFEY